jgi:hypothetical protein
MSFADAGSRGGNGARGSLRRGSSNSSTTGDPLQSLSFELQSLQKFYIRTNDVVGKLKGEKKKISQMKKQDLDKDVRQIRELEIRIKNQLDGHMRELESLPKSGIAQRRIAIGKISKDFERIQGGINVMVNDLNSLKVDGKANESSKHKSGVTTTNSGAFAGKKQSIFRLSTSSKKDIEETSEYRKHEAKIEESFAAQQQQQISGQNVDDLLIEEREKDLLKMNRDLKLVNEMFKDMAQIVEGQGEMVEKVAESAEESHERAKAGLEQVQQAARYQSSCTIS